jgi:hypothetical protein
MATTKSRHQLDLGPRRVGVHFRKPACRSVACGEVLVRGVGEDFDARARSTGPPHEEGGSARCGRFAPLVGGFQGRPWYGSARCAPQQQASASTTNIRGSVLARRSNKAMQLTRGGWKRGVA